MTDTAIPDGFKPWHGGVCPTDADEVMYVLRQAPTHILGPSPPKLLRWDHGRTPESAAKHSGYRPNDIVGWKPVCAEPTQQHTLDPVALEAAYMAWSSKYRSGLAGNDKIALSLAVEAYINAAPVDPEIAALRHDLERQMAIANEHVNRTAQLEAEKARLVKALGSIAETPWSEKEMRQLARTTLSAIERGAES